MWQIIQPIIRVIIFNNCSADLLTSQEQAALNFRIMTADQPPKKIRNILPLVHFVGIVDVTNEMTIKVGDKTLVNGTDYNKYVEYYRNSAVLLFIDRTAVFYIIFCL